MLFLKSDFTYNNYIAHKNFIKVDYLKTMFFELSPFYLLIIMTSETQNTDYKPRQRPGRRQTPLRMKSSEKY